MSSPTLAQRRVTSAAVPLLKDFRRRLRRLVAVVNRRARRLQLAIDRRRGIRVVHLLHVGKTGGTALKHMLQQVELPNRRIVLHDHAVTLADVPRGDKVVFFVRDPVSRFESGFWSRQREGRPAHYVPWTKAEARAFAEFPTPSELAIALSDSDPQRRARAEQAMGDIAHLRTGLSKWLKSTDYLRSRADDILFIGFFETLEADARQLIEVLGADPSLGLPQDDGVAHRRPRHQHIPLDPQAVQNLERWYAPDYALIEACRELMAARRAAG